MVAILSAVVSIFAFRFRGRASLELELVALRHQVTVLRRQRPGRPQLSSLDRLLWVWLYRIWPQVIDAMVLVKPATVVQWHRKGLRLYWRWRPRRPGRPKISTEIRDLIRRMSRANPLWGAPRIHGELLKLGIEISQATVGRWMPWRPKVRRVKKLVGGRILCSGVKLTDAERATLAEIGHPLGRRLSPRLASVARPDTILAWYRAGPHPTSGETFETIEDQRANKPAAAA